MNVSGTPSAPRRIVVVVRSLKMGGVERHAIHLANALADLGHEVHLLSLKKVADIANETRVTVHLRDFDKAFRRTGVGLVLDLVARALLALLSRKSDFVWRGFIGGWYLRRFVRELERHGGPIERIMLVGQSSYERALSWRDPRIYLVVVSPPRPPRATGIDRWHSSLLYANRNLVSNSSGTRDALAERLRIHGVVAKTHVIITNPCPIAHVRALAEEAAPVPKEPYLVHVSRLTLQKNQPLLLRAYKAAKVEEKLVIVGGGQEERKLKALARELEIADKVMFVGQQANPYPWMKHARLFILSSLYEGLGFVMVEALACGIPVVAVDCPGGVRDVLVEEQRRLIAEPTVTGLAEKIREGLANPVPIRDEWVLRYEPATIATQFLAL